VGRRLIVEADGGSRGNPGKAGYGALVRDPGTGAVIAERARSVGIASNNVAEYSGLIAGLRAAQSIDAGADIEARMDSKLVVEQMSGRWKIKHQDLRRLALEARDVAAEISAAGGSVTFTWVPRAENSAADALANAAMDGQTIERDPADLAGPDETPGEAAAPGDANATGPSSDVAGAMRTPVQEQVISDSRHADLDAPSRIILVRHGVTNFTVAGKLDGRGGADPSLNEQGRSQAKAAGAAVRELLEDMPHGPVRVLSSSLARAVETGEAVAAALGLEPVIDADWDEQGFGDWDGKSMAQIAARFPDDLRSLRTDDDYARPGGESHRQLFERVGGALHRAVDLGGTVVVATHRKPIMCVLSQLLAIPHERLWSIATSPASLTGIEVWADGGFSVSFVNDTHHLTR
jgi:probable phosphoglycerate mutase